MAEGLLGGLLGGEEAEAPETEADAPSLGAAQAHAIAIAMEEARHDPKVAEAALRFLDRQARLLDAQAGQIEAEEPIRLHHLRGQTREAALRRASQRLRLGTQALVTVLCGVLGFCALLMLYGAITSRAVVVDAFDAPPALAGAGISGKVVASEVLDALQVLADTNRTRETSLATQSAWSSEVRIELPETGVSVGEVDRLLHERLGHDLHVGGSLIQAGDGALTLSVRGDELAPRSFTGAAGELARLATQAAEYIYGRSQPVALASYLNAHHRGGDTLAFLPEAFARADSDRLRSALANAWGNAFADLDRAAPAVEKWRLAISLDPDNWPPRVNLPTGLAQTEGEEAA